MSAQWLFLLLAIVVGGLHNDMSTPPLALPARDRITVGVPGVMDAFVPATTGIAGPITLRETEETHQRSLDKLYGVDVLGAAHPDSILQLARTGAIKVQRVSSAQRALVWQATKHPYVSASIATAVAYLNSARLVVVRAPTYGKEFRTRGEHGEDRSVLPHIYEELKAGIYTRLQAEGLAPLFFREETRIMSSAGGKSTRARVLRPVMLDPSEYEFDRVVMRDESGASQVKYMVLANVPVYSDTTKTAIRWQLVHDPNALVFTAANGLDWEPDANGDLRSPLARVLPLLERYEDTVRIAQLSDRVRVNPAFIVRKSKSAEDVARRAAELSHRDAGDAAALAREIAQPSRRFAQGEESLFAPDAGLMSRLSTAITQQAAATETTEDVMRFVNAMNVFEQSRALLALPAGRGGGDSGIFDPLAATGLGTTPRAIAGGIAARNTAMLPDPMHADAWQNNILLLSSGYEMQPGHIPPAVREDLVTIEETLQEQISAVLGVPRHLVMGSNRKTHHESLASVIAVNATFRQTMDGIKDAIADIITEVYAYCSLAAYVGRVDTIAEPPKDDDDDAERPKRQRGPAQEEQRQREMASYDEVMGLIHIDASGRRSLHVEFAPHIMANPVELAPWWQVGGLTWKSVMHSLADYYKLPISDIESFQDPLSAAEKHEFAMQMFGRAQAKQQQQPSRKRPAEEKPDGIAKDAAAARKTAVKAATAVKAEGEV